MRRTTEGLQNPSFLGPLRRRCCARRCRMSCRAPGATGAMRRPTEGLQNPRYPQRCRRCCARRCRTGCMAPGPTSAMHRLSEGFQSPCYPQCHRRRAQRRRCMSFRARSEEVLCLIEGLNTLIR